MFAFQFYKDKGASTPDNSSSLFFAQLYIDRENKEKKIERGGGGQQHVSKQTFRLSSYFLLDVTMNLEEYRIFYAIFRNMFVYIFIFSFAFLQQI